MAVIGSAKSRTQKVFEIIQMSQVERELIGVISLY